MQQYTYIRAKIKQKKPYTFSAYISPLQMKIKCLVFFSCNLKIEVNDLIT